MTIAIGEMFQFGDLKGALVCADSRIVSTDLATTVGSKIHLSLTPRRSAFAIADAAEDGNAAKMLAKDITIALCAESVVHVGHVPEVVKKIMTEWFAAFSGARPPATEFVLAAAVRGVCNVFYCSPPNTVLEKSPALAVGQGARVVDPLLPNGTSVLPCTREAVLRAAYWMNRAKRDEGSMCGGITHMFMISEKGGIALSDSKQLAAAESFAEEVDALVSDFTHGVLSGKSDEEQKEQLRIFSEQYVKLDQQAKSLDLLGMEMLGGDWGKRARNKPQLKKPVLNASS